MSQSVSDSLTLDLIQLLPRLGLSASFETTKKVGSRQNAHPDKS